MKLVKNMNVKMDTLVELYVGEGCGGAYITNGTGCNNGSGTGGGCSSGKGNGGMCR